jgi:hypothetical protein
MKRTPFVVGLVSAVETNEEFARRPFPLGVSVVVQALNTETGAVRESRFDTADVTKSDAFHYKAKAQ